MINNCIREVIYSTKYGQTFIAQTTAHQWILFITASIYDYTKENRT